MRLEERGVDVTKYSVEGVEVYAVRVEEGVTNDDLYVVGEHFFIGTTHQYVFVDGRGGVTKEARKEHEIVLSAHPCGVIVGKEGEEEGTLVLVSGERVECTGTFLEGTGEYAFFKDADGDTRRGKVTPDGYVCARIMMCVLVCA